MAQCEVCGNNYDKSFEAVRGGKSHTFDSFECAIHLLAPICAHCHCRIVGHGLPAQCVRYRIGAGILNRHVGRDQCEEQDREQRDCTAERAIAERRAARSGALLHSAEA